MRHTNKILLLSTGILFFIDSLCQDRDTSLPNLIPYRKGDLWGYCDKNKNLILPAKYSWAEPFIAGRAIVHFDDKKHGVIDSLGKELLTIGKDTMITIWSNGSVLIEKKFVDIIFVLQKDGSVFRSKKYKLKFPFDENSYVAAKGKKWGVIDNKENVIIPFKFKVVSEIDDKGYIMVTNKDGKRGFINKEGRFIIPYFKQGIIIGGFDDDRALIGIGEQFKETWGYMDRTGKTVIPLQYKKAEGFIDGLAIAGNDKLAGIIDLNGDTILPFKFTSLQWLSNKMYSFSDSLRSGIIKISGEELFTTRRGSCCSSVAGVFFVYDVANWEGNAFKMRYKVIDKNGNEAFPEKFGVFFPAGPGLISVTDDDGKSYYMDFNRNKYYED